MLGRMLLDVLFAVNSRGLIFGPFVTWAIVPVNGNQAWLAWKSPIDADFNGKLFYKIYKW